jgi:chromosome partitioning protein
MKSDIIIFSNQKGGVGKTTLCREIGIALAFQGLIVLLVDCDPQGNLSKSLTSNEHTVPGLYEALDGGPSTPLGTSAVNIQNLGDNLSLLSGDFRLASLEKSLVGEMDAYGRLTELLSSELFQAYDLILVDTPPSLGVLTGNALAAGKHIIIPMRPSLYSMQGTNDLVKTIAKVRKTLNPDLNLLGVIINGFDSIPVIVKEIRKEIEESFGTKVFGTALSETIKFEEAIAEKKGVIHLKKLDKSRAKLEVERISVELLVRLGVVSSTGEAPNG